MKKVIVEFEFEEEEDFYTLTRARLVKNELDIDARLGVGERLTQDDTWWSFAPEALCELFETGGTVNYGR